MPASPDLFQDAGESRWPETGAVARILNLTNKTPSKTITVADESLQAFSQYPLVDCVVFHELREPK